MLVRWLDLLEVWPPLVSIFQKDGQGILVMLLFQLLLLRNFFFRNEFPFHQIRHNVNHELQFSERTALSQINRQDLGIHLDGIGVKHTSPIQISGTYHHRFLIPLVPQDSDVKWLLQLQQERCIKFWLLEIALDFKEEGLAECHVTVGLHFARLIPVLQKANSYWDVFVVTATHIVYEGGSMDYLYLEILFVLV